MDNWQVIETTLKLSLLTVAILMLIGTPLAWWLSKTNYRFKIVVEAITALPLVLPPTVLGFYLLLLFGSQGALGQVWISFTGHALAFTFSGLVLASCLYSLPFVVQPLQTAFDAIDKRMVEAARTLGDTYVESFFFIVVPQAKRGFITALVLGFAHTVGEFGVVLMVGGNIPGETQVVSISIYEQVEMLNYSAAQSMSLSLLVFSFLVLLSVYTMNQRWSVKI